MKSMIMVLASVVCAQSAQAFLSSDITIGGASAQRLYGQLSQRSENVSQSSGTSSILGRATESINLLGVLVCTAKDGFIRTSYNCVLPATHYQDIQATRVIDFSSPSGDATADLLSGLAGVANVLHNQQALTISGASAQNLYRVLSHSNDSSVQKTSGVTKFRKRQFNAVAITEMQCFETENKIKWLNGASSYECVIPAAIANDSNMPVTVISDN